MGGSKGMELTPEMAFVVEGMEAGVELIEDVTVDVGCYTLGGRRVTKNAMNGLRKRKIIRRGVNGWPRFKWSLIPSR